MIATKHRTANRHTSRNRRTNVGAHTNCVAKRKELDPTFYPDIFAFRKAVEDGTVDPSKGCQNMDEYFASVSHEQV